MENRDRLRLLVLEQEKRRRANAAQPKEPGMVQQASGMIGEAVQSNPAVQAGQTAMQALKMLQKGADWTGEKVTEQLSTPQKRLSPTTPYAGLQNPYPLPAKLAGGIGAGIQMLPHAALAAIPAGKAKDAPKALMGLRKIAAKFKPKSAAEKRSIKWLKDELKRLPVQKDKQMQHLEKVRKGWSKRIGKVREAENIPQGPMGEANLPKSDEVLRFADEMTELSKTPTPQLAKEMGKGGLADLKDVWQLMREGGLVKEGTRVSAEINKAEQAVDAALGLVAPKTAGAIKGYRRAKAGLANVPKAAVRDLKIIKEELWKKMLKAKGGRVKQTAKKALKMLVKVGVVAGAAGIGGTVGAKIAGGMF